MSWLYTFYCIFFFHKVRGVLLHKHDSRWISTSSLFSGADYTRKMHHIFLCYGLPLARDSKLFIINLISLRAVSSSVAGVLSIKDQIRCFVSESFPFSKMLSFEEKPPTQQVHVLQYLFIYIYYIVQAEQNLLQIVNLHLF